MNRHLAVVLVATTLLATPLHAQATVESVTPLIRQAFAADGCAYPLDTAQADLASRIAMNTGVPYEDLTNPADSMYQAIDAAIGQMMGDGRITVDTQGSRVVMPGCGG